jgi:hypothetical protein
MKMRKGIELFSVEEEQRIIRDCVKAAKNIESLTKKAYHFLYLSSNFIAHYDRGGFMDNYSEPGSLKRDILTYQRDNQWGNFHPGERDYDYYMQRKKIYNTICDCIRQDIEFKPKRNKEKEMEFDFGR